MCSTHSFDVVNEAATLLVDGLLMEFKIIEEWVFALGEDACLFEEESESEIEPETHEELGENVDNCDVDDLVNNLTRD